MNKIDHFMCILLYRTRSLQSYKFLFRRTPHKPVDPGDGVIQIYMVFIFLNTFTETLNKQARCLNHLAYVRVIRQNAMNVLISFLFILGLLINQVHDYKQQRYLQRIWLLLDWLYKIKKKIKEGWRFNAWENSEFFYIRKFQRKNVDFRFLS